MIRGALVGLIYLVYASTSSYGLYKLKVSERLFDSHFFIGFFLYGTGFLIWLYILKLNPLSLAFPIASGALIVATQLVGVLLLEEKFTIIQSVGVTIIIIGIVITFISK